MKKIKKGYKQTEIGVIPVDWEVVTFSEKFTIKNGLNKAKEFFGYGTPIVNYMDVFANSGLYKKDVQGKVFLSSQEKENYKVKIGDLLFTRTSETPKEIGMSSVVLEKIPHAVFSGFVLRARPKDETFNNEFKKYCFRSSEVRKQIISTCSYTTRALTNGKSLSVIKVLLPPLPEQKAIAQVLSDTDELIQALEQKLAKKKAIKQGAMQQLLAPKKDWEERKLGEIAKYRRGSFPQPYGLPQWYDTNNGMPFVQVYDVGKNMKLKPTTKQKISDLAKDKSIFVKKGNVILTIQGSIGRIAITQYDAYVDRTLLIFTDYKIPIDRMFFTYVVQEKFKIEKENAPGGIIKTITKEELSKFDIPLPSTKKEQTEIATILSDMDKEIEQIETQLSKYKQIKQGLMQNLLTGKIRLTLDSLD